MRPKMTPDEIRALAKKIEDKRLEVLREKEKMKAEGMPSSMRYILGLQLDLTLMGLIAEANTQMIADLYSYVTSPPPLQTTN